MTCGDDTTFGDKRCTLIKWRQGGFAVDDRYKPLQLRDCVSAAGRIIRRHQGEIDQVETVEGVAEEYSLRILQRRSLRLAILQATADGVQLRSAFRQGWTSILLIFERIESCQPTNSIVA